MAKQIDFSRVANKLVLIYSQHKTDNNMSTWKKAFKDILNAQEAKRLYELFSGELQLLQSTGGRNLCWSNSTNKDNFTRDWCKTLFEKYGIQSVFGPTLGVDGKMLHPRANCTRTSESVSDKRASKLVVKEPASSEESSYNPLHTLKSFTDEELLAELQRREDERKAAAELARKKALVDEFLAAYDMTIDDLLEIAQVI